MFVMMLLIVFLFYFGMKNLKGYQEMNSKALYSTYECGYQEMTYNNMLYSSQFFVLALSFMLFDLEIVFFLPYFIFYFYSYMIVYMLMFFLMLLLLGLYYELFQKIV
uniref:NADH-ubiquinone oxidoreductase chain 3 n=1 Tax=Didemnum vexillum TaxID=516032 RepID=A0A0A7LFU6_9ASCI|nr:NADH dehydrogenase subunit 3 [Didemnum vexillum]AIZ58125.1 NADH dehydrogenase subunit 3 [Didemnum vexillum]AIZ58137.1 NADH dehydrogenase subunit 3 [Didemnum vexillum]UYK51629.1 NADH dehydrogenase subunit 3 [Didemnum vexillum]